MNKDSDYVKWLEINHPETVPAESYTLVSTVEGLQMTKGIDSVVYHFSEVTPLHAVAHDIDQFV